MIITAMVCLAGFVAGAASTAYAIFWFLREMDRDDAEFTVRMRKAERELRMTSFIYSSGNGCDGS